MKSNTTKTPPTRAERSNGSANADDDRQARATSFSPRTIREMLELERRENVEMGWSDRAANRIVAIAGSNAYVWLHVVWFTAWIVFNLTGLAFDPYPFGLLTATVSLEAIFLAIFVLMSQNRQAVVADKRSKVELQVNLIAEREVTKLMAMVADIYEHLGVGPVDPEVEAMLEPTHVRTLADTVDAIEARKNKEASKPPESAVDTD